jgi:hypothetical protein
MKLERQKLGEDEARCTIEGSFRELESFSRLMTRGSLELYGLDGEYDKAFYELAVSDKKEILVEDVLISQDDDFENKRVTYRIQGPEEKIDKIGEMINTGVSKTEEKLPSSEVLDDYKELFSKFFEEGYDEVEMHIE